MTSTILPFRALLLSLLSLMIIMRAESAYADTDVTGHWSGTFTSNHSDTAPFTVMILINKDSSGRIIGDSTLGSHCLKGAHLEVTVTGSSVVLAGSDQQGDNMTVQGSLDVTGTLLNSTYILNGSATGGCETDDGTGTLQKK
jgi:hypothetical protein